MNVSLSIADKIRSVQNMVRAVKRPLQPFNNLSTINDENYEENSLINNNEAPFLSNLKITSKGNTEMDKNAFSALYASGPFNVKSSRHTSMDSPPKQYSTSIQILKKSPRVDDVQITGNNYRLLLSRVSSGEKIKNRRDKKLSSKLLHAGGVEEVYGEEISTTDDSTLLSSSDDTTDLMINLKTQIPAKPNKPRQSKKTTASIERLSRPRTYTKAVRNQSLEQLAKDAAEKVVYKNPLYKCEPRYLDVFKKDESELAEDAYNRHHHRPRDVSTPTTAADPFYRMRDYFEKTDYPYVGSYDDQRSEFPIAVVNIHL